MGVYLPPPVEFVASVTFPGVLTAPAHIVRCAKYAGLSVGSAVIRFPTVPAMRGEIGYGQAARLSCLNETLFRGTVGSAPLVIDSGKDDVEIILFDDKWGMRSRVIGQHGIGTGSGSDKGFTDVGFECVFNPGGRPNKSADGLDFSMGTDAEFWTLAQIMQFVFEYYVAADVATLQSAQLDEAYERIPVDVSLVGMEALQAVDAIAKMAGQSWGLEPGANSSRFVAVKANGGTERIVKVFVPGQNITVESVDVFTARSVHVTPSIIEAKDVHMASSARIVMETTISSAGSNPVLQRQADFASNEFAARFISDVSQYEANGIGANLSEGSPAKAWWSDLVTRVTSDGSGYVTAAEMEANPALQSNPRLQIPLWLSMDGTSGSARLCVDGYEIDHENGLIDFESEVTLMTNAGAKDKVTPNWSTAQIWITVAVVLEKPQWVVSEEESEYLPTAFHLLIEADSIQPEKRFNSVLPTLGANKNARASVAGALESYVDVTERLEEIVDASVESRPEIETAIRVAFPLFPIIEIGDRPKFQSRDIGATGDEVIVAVEYGIHGAFITEIEATQVLSGIDPERFKTK